MAGTRTITKNLAGVQDLLLGKGQVEQTRSGGLYPIDRIDVPVTVDTVEEMQAVDILLYTRARVYSAVNAYEDYVYDPASTAGIPSSNGDGSWRKLVRSDIVDNSFKSFDSLTSAIGYVIANPTEVERLYTASRRNEAECLALSIPYPDASGAEYIVGTGFGAADGGYILDAGATQLKFNGDKLHAGHYGIGSNDAVIDQAAADSYVAAILNNSWKTLRFPDGDFLLNNYILVPTSVTCIAMGAETTIVQTAALPIFLKRGFIDTAGAVAVSDLMLKGETFVTTDTAHGYVAGDWIYVRSNTLTPNVTAGSRVSILRKVIDASSTTFRMDKPVFRDMDSSITIRKATLGDAITITGGTLKHAVPVDNKEALIHFYMCKGPDLVGVNVKKNGGPAILLQNCVGGSFTDSHISDLLDGEHTDSNLVVSNYFGYGLAFSGCTRDFTAYSGSIGRVRHAVTTITVNDTAFNAIPAGEASTVLLRGEPEGIYIDAVLCYETTEAALDTHEQGYDITFVPNITGCFRGVLIRATDVFVLGGSIRGARRYGILASGPASNAVAQVSLRPVIKNTVISVVGEDGLNQGQEAKGIYVATEASVVEVSNVTIKGCREESVLVADGNILRLRSSTIDGDGVASLNTGIRLDGSGSLIESCTIANCHEGISAAVASSNTITNPLYDSNATDYIEE